ncbi:unnamed protein product, partial [Strongylus vulgaris]
MERPQLEDRTKKVAHVSILDMDAAQMEKLQHWDQEMTDVMTADMRSWLILEVEKSLLRLFLIMKLPLFNKAKIFIKLYGCCPDGESKAIGPDYAGCPSTTLAPFLLGGTVAPSKISSCALPQDQGAVCASGYKLVWYYDTTEGRCSQFWYGGCEGNDNRFATKEQCETICVEPPGIGRCYLPKIEGPLRCDVPQARYWYDYNTKQCAAFWWRGCHGNANNFGSWEECS